MCKRIARRATAAVKMTIVLISLVACDGGAAKPEMKPVNFYGSGVSMQGEVAADTALTIQQASIEQHHFAIYVNYRDMFEERPTLWRDVAFGVVDDYLRNTGMRFNDSKLEHRPRACSMRTLFLLD